MKRIMKAVLVPAAAVAVMFGTGACSIPSTTSDQILVHKGGGPFDDQGDRGCIQPATRSVEDANDNYFSYPANQRTYNFNSTSNADGPPITVVSKDGQTLSISGTLSFNLNPDCKTLHAFHDKVGNREHAYFEDPAVTPEGWLKVLNTYMRPALDGTLDRTAKQYDWRQLYSDVTIKDKMNEDVNSQILRLVNDRFEGNEQFFINFSSLILQPQADAELVASVKANEVSKAQAQATETKAKADAAAAEAGSRAQVSQKKAELTVAQIEAQIKEAEIKAYGGIKDYNNNLAIQKGLNPFQPTYGGSVLTPAK
jgi:hypothetical protein